MGFSYAVLHTQFVTVKCLFNSV